MAQSTAEASDLELDYVQLADRGWRVLRRLGVAESLLADATQDALLVVHRRHQDFRGDSTFSTWFYGVLLRVASSYRRKDKRANAVFDAGAPAPEEWAASREPTPLESLEQRAAAAVLGALLDELPEEAREVFVMVELEELTLADTALVLSIKASTCKSRLRTARRLFNAAVAREHARQRRREAGT